MAKNGYIRARIEEDLKANVSDVLSAIGLSHTDVITMLYKAIDAYKGIPPILSKVPNAETIEAMEDVKNGKNLINYGSVQAVLDDWDTSSE